MVRSASHFWRKARSQKRKPRRSGPPTKPLESDFWRSSARALRWIKSATLTARRSLPIFPHEPISAARYVSKVPICDMERERRGLVEGHADPLPFAPDDVTRNVRAVRFKDKIKTIGDVAGVSNFERRPRNGNVAD